MSPPIVVICCICSITVGCRFQLINSSLGTTITITSCPSSSWLLPIGSPFFLTILQSNQEIGYPFSTFVQVSCIGLKTNGTSSSLTYNNLPSQITLSAQDKLADLSSSNARNHGENCTHNLPLPVVSSCSELHTEHNRLAYSITQRWLSRRTQKPDSWLQQCAFCLNRTLLIAICSPKETTSC